MTENGFGWPWMYWGVLFLYVIENMFYTFFHTSFSIHHLSFIYHSCVLAPPFAKEGVKICPPLPLFRQPPANLWPRVWQNSSSLSSTTPLPPPPPPGIRKKRNRKPRQTSKCPPRWPSCMWLPWFVLWGSVFPCYWMRRKCLTTSSCTTSLIAMVSLVSLFFKRFTVNHQTDGWWNSMYVC